MKRSLKKIAALGGGAYRRITSRLPCILGHGFVKRSHDIYMFIDEGLPIQ